jgi:hypothetical protein
MRDKNINQTLENGSRQSGVLSKDIRWRRWSDEEIEIIAREDITDYQKAKLISQRTDASVRRTRKRMGFKSLPVVFNRRFEHGGYTLVRKDGGYKRNNRIIAEKKIGRPLKRTEIVHHINGDKLDDRPENLYICRSRSEHNTIHRETMEIIYTLMEQNKVKFINGKYILC